MVLATSSMPLLCRGAHLINPKCVETLDFLPDVVEGVLLFQCLKHGLRTPPAPGSEVLLVVDRHAPLIDRVGSGIVRLMLVDRLHLVPVIDVEGYLRPTRRSPPDLDGYPPEDREDVLPLSPV